MSQIRVSKHALERYCERVKPALDHEAASADLSALLSRARIVAEAPRWTGHCVDGPVNIECFAVLCDGVVLPLARERGVLVAVTCLTRGGLSPQQRERRNQSARARRFKRMAHRRKWDDKRGRKVSA